MLKLQYTENGLFMERVNGSVDSFLAQRASLVLRSGCALHVQPGRASFLLLADAPALSELELLLWLEQSPVMGLYRVDVDYVEVSVEGIWITEQVDSEEGIFLLSVSNSIERPLYQLWQQGQRSASSRA